MIDVTDSLFSLETNHTSNLFRVTEHGHLEHIHYGALLPLGEIASLTTKRVIMHGSSVVYDTVKNSNYCLYNIPLEWSGVGCGDYRQTPIEVKLSNGTYRTDFVYDSHEILSGCVPMETLPSAYDDEDTAQTLRLTMVDHVAALELQLYYTVFPKVDVITRRALLINHGAGEVCIRRLMSICSWTWRTRDSPLLPSMARGSKRRTGMIANCITVSL